MPLTPALTPMLEKAKTEREAEATRRWLMQAAAERAEAGDEDGANAGVGGCGASSVAEQSQHTVTPPHRRRQQTPLIKLRTLYRWTGRATTTRRIK